MSHDPIFFTVPSGDTKRSRILNKGGGGGDNGAAQQAQQREDDRQSRIQAGTDAVNSIFGYGNSGAQQQRQAMYDSTKNDTRTFYARQLEEDKAAAQRQLEFQKARQGIIGSSQANDLDTEFQKRYDRGLLDISNRAENAATQFRTSDEQARLGLISKVVAGLDQGSAAQNAMSTLQTNANAAKENYQSQRMGNVFADLLGSYQQQQLNAGMQAGKQQTNQYGNAFPTQDGVSGQVTSS